MRNFSLVLTIPTVMVAFAANSLLCKIALKGGHIDAVTFSNLRLISGALILLPFTFKSVLFKITKNTLLNSLYLMGYAVFFSIAYVKLDAGAGALILFGSVQLTMVLYGVRCGERMGTTRIIGVIVALLGLLILLLPGSKSPPVSSALLMLLSGICWAAYTIAGKKTLNPGLTTSQNFILAVPMALGISFFFSEDLHMDSVGVTLSILSGAAASAAAYVIWYSLLPNLDSVTASTLQLSVPCLAMLGGAFFLNESLDVRKMTSTLVVLIGILLVIRSKPATIN
ncbi:DMT family transporter [Pantoea rwandensis]|uniref:EamA domain-containing protein n=1 Tax=Pantoea rwandensis TaxID=1076550 RepID=A0A1X1D3B3_9GAMM|nr:DMT family transporter [Pantoea rwandensis]ORM71168.1 hypothetical protein HA51_04625 [Pantoea rwandensis]